MKFQGLELVSNALCIVGESPVWDEKRNSLHYVDIRGKRLRTLNSFFTCSVFCRRTAKSLFENSAEI